MKALTIKEMNEYIHTDHTSELSCITVDKGPMKYIGFNIINGKYDISKINEYSKNYSVVIYIGKAKTKFSNGINLDVGTKFQSQSDTKYNINDRISNKESGWKNEAEYVHVFLLKDVIRDESPRKFDKFNLGIEAYWQHALESEYGYITNEKKCNIATIKEHFKYSEKLYDDYGLIIKEFIDRYVGKNNVDNKNESIVDNKNESIVDDTWKVEEMAKDSLQNTTTSTTDEVNVSQPIDTLTLEYFYKLIKDSGRNYRKKSIILTVPYIQRYINKEKIYRSDILRLYKEGAVLDLLNLFVDANNDRIHIKHNNKSYYQLPRNHKSLTKVKITDNLILNILENNPNGLSLYDIANVTGYNVNGSLWRSTAKLVNENKIIKTFIGKKAFYRHASKISTQQTLPI